MKAILVVAIAENNVIGKDNDLIWHLPKDLQFFKKTTTGGVVVMGRNSYESIPEKYRPLPNRVNVVVTRNKEYKADNCVVLNSLTEVYAKYRRIEQVFIIGGAQIYQQALEQDWIDEMYISHVNASFEGDAFFPKIDPAKWNIEEVESHDADEKHAVGFTVKHYKKK